MNEPKRIKTLMNTDVYSDIKSYFKELFEERKALPSLKIKEAQLIEDMESRFGKKYDAKAIAALLHNGFEVEPGIYLFMREDFIAPPVRFIEGVSHA